MSPVEWTELLKRLREVQRSMTHRATHGQKSTSSPSSPAAKRKGDGHLPSEEDGTFPDLWREEMWTERDPATGKRFPNIMAMRTAKLREWFWYAQHHMTFSSHVACRDFFINPEKVLAQLRDDFDLTPIDRNAWDLQQCVLENGVSWCSDKPHSEGLQPWHNTKQKLKREHYLNGRYLDSMDQVSFDVINAWIDPALEGVLGYKALGSVHDARTPYNEQTRCGKHLAPSNYSGLGSCSS